MNNAIPVIARLTIRETQRRRLLWIGAFMGVGFLAIFGLGFHFVYADLQRNLSSGEFDAPLLFLTLAGLYATNFLVILVSVLISVTTISGEVESHTIESLLTKPIGRWQLVIGKWLGYAAIISLYVVFMPGGVLLIVYLESGFTLNNVALAMLLMYLEGLTGLSVSIAGGTRLSTLANGAVALMLFGMAFIGGWVEQIGAIMRNETAVDIGIATSLIMPTEILWRKATAVLEPQLVTGLGVSNPFSIGSQPSDLMILYAALYVVGLVAFSIWLFAGRDL
ncbi:MAG: ABC transporter permease subunit [Chloroflexota bacterium]|jgi:ABC-type transport system involved in multi-copper enzyme maturation permease subunit